MANTIRPVQYPDFHVIGRRTGTQADLQQQEFLTHCPPDLPPRHRIVALLGVTDDYQLANPTLDGWFVSDFYLFYHLLAPVAPRKPPNQIWLTSENPEELVNKYTEYLHGDSNGERRVVLDRQMLPGIVESGRLRVVPRDALLERFLNTLREQAAEAIRCEEQLVVLIFGHGDIHHKVWVAGSTLRMMDLRRLLDNTPRVTIFTTSCYSGGWLVSPNVKGRFLNSTAITAAGEDSVSSSWAQSESVGRASGSLAATGILRCLIEAEVEQKRTQEQAQLMQTGVLGGDIVSTMEHPTYIQFAKCIYESVKGMGLLGSKQEIYFSAEDDEWEMSYQPRLGLPLSSYKEKWESLRAVSPSASSGQTTPASRTGGRPVKRLRYLAEEYLASNPGADSLSPNVALHGDLRRILRGETPVQEVNNLIETTAYRLGSMYEADYLRQEVGIQYPSIFDMDTQNVIVSLPPTTQPMRRKTWDLLTRYDINTTPVGIRLQYGKPVQYLTLALIETSSSWDVIESRIHAMASKKKAWFRFIYRAWQGNRVAHDKDVQTSQRAFFEAFKKIGK